MWAGGRAALVCALLVVLQQSALWGGPTLPLRFGWDSDIMAGVSPTDARAASRVWVRITVNQKAVDREPSVTVYDTAGALRKAVASSQVEVLTSPPSCA